MGFGFNLFFIFILAPLTGIFLLTWLVTRKVIIGKIIGIVWLAIFGLFLMANITKWLTAKTVLAKEDYYGEYVIKRDFFKGKQSDWQYNHFRFEIKKNDSIYFYITEKESIIKTYKGKVNTTEYYKSARLIVNMNQPIPHILVNNPTTYRSAWDFYLVFNSPKFYNVFFEKGKWESIE